MESPPTEEGETTKSQHTRNQSAPPPTIDSFGAGASSPADLIQPPPPIPRRKSSKDTDLTPNSEHSGSTRTAPDSMIEQKISKYDIVRVRIFVEDHFYIFSRFIISRILTVNKIPAKDSIRIAMDLKKSLVEEDRLDLSQEEMEERLFRIMQEKYNYTEKYIRRYNMMNEFYHQRIPLCILISGPPLCGKSTLTTQLADLINLSNVLQTEIVMNVMQKMDQTIGLRPFWAYEQSERIQQFRQECSIARRGVSMDLQKCLTDGKGLIIEGYQVEPTLYFSEEARNQQVHAPLTPDSRLSKKLKIQPKNAVEIQTEAERKVNAAIGNIDQSKAVIVPFLITISEKDHAYLIEKWLSSSIGPDIRRELELLGNRKSQLQHLLSSFQEIQSWLLQYSDTTTVIPINIQNIEDTIDQMHNVILARIESAHDQGDF